MQHKIYFEKPSFIVQELADLLAITHAQYLPWAYSGYKDDARFYVEIEVADNIAPSDLQTLETAILAIVAGYDHTVYVNALAYQNKKEADRLNSVIVLSADYVALKAQVEQDRADIAINTNRIADLQTAIDTIPKPI
jgi:GTP:adenosylcobinamide-phosphate guanylyltransferase